MPVVSFILGALPTMVLISVITSIAALGRCFGACHEKGRLPLPLASELEDEDKHERGWARKASPSPRPGRSGSSETSIDFSMGTSDDNESSIPSRTPTSDPSVDWDVGIDERTPLMGPNRSSLRTPRATPVLPAIAASPPSSSPSPGPMSGLTMVSCPMKRTVSFLQNQAYPSPLSVSPVGPDSSSGPELLVVGSGSPSGAGLDNVHGEAMSSEQWFASLLGEGGEEVEKDCHPLAPPTPPPTGPSSAALAGDPENAQVAAENPPLAGGGGRPTVLGVSGYSPQPRKAGISPLLHRRTRSSAAALQRFAMEASSLPLLAPEVTGRVVPTPHLPAREAIFLEEAGVHLRENFPATPLDPHMEVFTPTRKGRAECIHPPPTPSTISPPASPGLPINGNINEYPALVPGDGKGEKDRRAGGGDSVHSSPESEHTSVGSSSARWSSTEIPGEDATHAALSSPASPSCERASLSSGIVGMLTEELFVPRDAFAIVAQGFLDLEPGWVKVGKAVAEGAFAQVREGSFRGKKVAVKLQEVPPDAQQQANLLGELGVLKQLTRHSERLVQYEGAGLLCNCSPPKVMMVMELCVRGALREVLKAGGGLSWGLKARLMEDVAEAMVVLHTNKILHRDIKTPNVLITSSWRAKVCDFNLVIHDRSINKKKNVAGTDEFMSPEALLGEEEYSFPSDMFSLGITLWEVIFESAPSETFLKRRPQDAFVLDLFELEALRDSEGEPAAEACAGCPISLWQLAVDCSDPDPDIRPTAEDAKEWLEGLVDDLCQGGEVETPEDMPAPAALPPVSPPGTNMEDQRGWVCGHLGGSVLEGVTKREGHTVAGSALDFQLKTLENISDRDLEMLKEKAETSFNKPRPSMPSYRWSGRLDGLKDSPVTAISPSGSKRLKRRCGGSLSPPRASYGREGGDEEWVLNTVARLQHLKDTLREQQRQLNNTAKSLTPGGGREKGKAEARRGAIAGASRASELPEECEKEDGGGEPGEKIEDLRRMVTTGPDLGGNSVPLPVEEPMRRNSSFFGVYQEEMLEAAMDLHQDDTADVRRNMAALKDKVEEDNRLVHELQALMKEANKIMAEALRAPGGPAPAQPAAVTAGLFPTRESPSHGGHGTRYSPHATALQRICTKATGIISDTGHSSGAMGGQKKHKKRGGALPGGGGGRNTQGQNNLGEFMCKYLRICEKMIKRAEAVTSQLQLRDAGEEVDEGVLQHSRSRFVDLLSQGEKAVRRNSVHRPPLNPC